MVKISKALRIVNPSTTLVLSNTQRQRRGRRTRRARGTTSMTTPDIPRELTLNYFKSLVDPFENSPPKVGWGCMVPSTILQGYRRSPLTIPATATDLVILQLPGANGSFGFFDSVTNAWTFQNLSNGSSITANAAEGRALSTGIRAFPNIALTVAPGSVYTGAVVATDVANILTLTTNDFINLPTSHQSIGTAGASATGRPIDPESFVFNLPSVNAAGYAGSTFQLTDLPFSVPYIVFVGLPAGSTVFVESVVNIECTNTVLHNAQTVLPDGDGITARLCDYWPSAESMYNRIAPMLPHPGRPGEAAASTDSTYLSSVWNTIRGIGGRGLSNVASNLFASGAGLALRSIAQRQFGLPTGSRQMLSRSQFGGYLQ